MSDVLKRWNGSTWVLVNELMRMTDESIPVIPTLVFSPLLTNTLTISSTPYTKSKFGIDVGANSSKVVVGSFLNNFIDVYNIDTGALLLTIQNPNTTQAQEVSYFGNALDMTELYILAGALGTEHSTDAAQRRSGFAYLFDMTGAEVYRFENPNMHLLPGWDAFGTDVALSDSYAIVGADQEDDIHNNFGNSGAAYIFGVSDGLLKHSIASPEPFGYGSFGRVVAAHGHCCAISAPANDPEGKFAGRVYVYDCITGVLMYTLSSEHPDTDWGYFGDGLDISDKYVVVGTPNKGNIQIFNVLTGDFIRMIESAAGDDFGRSVSIVDDWCLVSARKYDGQYVDSGRAYIYNVLTGELIHTFENPNAKQDTQTEDFFGWKLKMTSTHTVFGTPNEDYTGAYNSDSGVTYTFKLYE